MVLYCSAEAPTHVTFEQRCLMELTALIASLETIRTFELLFRLRPKAEVASALPMNTAAA